MADVNIESLARELMAAHDVGGTIGVPPSAREGGLDLATAYAVEAEIVRLRRETGRRTVGRKVGFANKALWRVLKLDTLVWSHMYDDTVHQASAGRASLGIGGRLAPRIEPEVVLKLQRALEPGVPDAAAALAAVDWIALGFEIIDCPFPGWQFTPADFVADLGLHAALVVGEPRRVSAETVAALVDELPRFKLALLRNDALVEEGSGRNSLRSPALCLAELAGVASRPPGTDPLAAGELVSTGTLTSPQPIAPGETWTARVAGTDLPELTVTFQ